MSTLTVHPLFKDHAVLQSDQIVPIWGNASAGEIIHIRFGEQHKKCTADKNGSWKTQLSAMPVSRVGKSLRIQCDEHEIELHDILIGSVWLCAGQSNMAFPLKNAEHGSNDAAVANFPEIRYFNIIRDRSDVPAQTVEAEQGGWVPISPDSAEVCSAVGFHFGRSLHQALDIPIGLIHNAWGGSAAECWVSAEALGNEASLAHLLNDNSQNDQRALDQHREDMHAYRERNATVLQEDPARTGLDDAWYAQEKDVAAWHTCDRPAVKTDDQLNGDGVVWYRTNIALPENFQNQNCTLHLGRLDCQRQIWVNDEQIEHCNRDVPFFWLRAIAHEINCSTLCSITIRACFQFCGGNAYGSSQNLVLINSAGEKLLLDDWYYRHECSYDNIDESTLDGGQPWPQHSVSWGLSQPVTMFNGLIAPLIPYALEGVIWYQGESNADRAEEYKRLLQVLIEDWRQRWNLPLPFGIVQLAAHTPILNEPMEQNSACLRLAQDWVCEQVPKCGLVTALDHGDADDIHPTNKCPIGERLAAWARAEVYKHDIAWKCPRYKSHKRIGNEVHLSFSHIHEALSVRDQEAVRGFAITDEHGKMHWAPAELDGNDAIIIDLSTCNNAISIHYAMSNNPDINVFDERQLPLLPFRCEI